MDPISNIILNRADDLFKSPPSPSFDFTQDCAGQALDLIIDLEAPLTTINDDDVLFQEEVPLSPLPAPKAPTKPETEKIDKLKIMIHSLRDQLDDMLRVINDDGK